jgi:hypothetical protein
VDEQHDGRAVVPGMLDDVHAVSVPSATARREK